MELDFVACIWGTPAIMLTVSAGSVRDCWKTPNVLSHPRWSAPVPPNCPLLGKLLQFSVNPAGQCASSAAGASAETFPGNRIGGGFAHVAGINRCRSYYLQNGVRLSAHAPASD